MVDGWQAQQDVADIASSRVVYDAARNAVEKGIEPEQLHFIANAVEDFKGLYKRARNC